MENLECFIACVELSRRTTGLYMPLSREVFNPYPSATGAPSNVVSEYSGATLDARVTPCVVCQWKSLDYAKGAKENCD